MSDNKSKQNEQVFKIDLSEYDKNGIITRDVDGNYANGFEKEVDYEQVQKFLFEKKLVGEEDLTPITVFNPPITQFSTVVESKHMDSLKNINESPYKINTEHIDKMEKEKKLNEIGKTAYELGLLNYNELKEELKNEIHNDMKKEINRLQNSINDIYNKMNANSQIQMVRADDSVKFESQLYIDGKLVTGQDAQNIVIPEFANINNYELNKIKEDHEILVETLNELGLDIEKIKELKKENEENNKTTSKTINAEKTTGKSGSFMKDNVANASSGYMFKTKSSSPSIWGSALGAVFGGVPGMLIGNSIGKQIEKNNIENNERITKLEVNTILGDYLKEKGISQTWLSERTGINRATLINIIKLPSSASYSNVQRISKVLDLPCDFLFPVSYETGRVEE